MDSEEIIQTLGGRFVALSAELEAVELEREEIRVAYGEEVDRCVRTEADLAAAVRRAEEALALIQRIEGLSEVTHELYDGDTFGAVRAALDDYRDERDAWKARAEAAEARLEQLKSDVRDFILDYCNGLGPDIGRLRDALSPEGPSEARKEET